MIWKTVKDVMTINYFQKKKRKTLGTIGATEVEELVKKYLSIIKRFEERYYTKTTHDGNSNVTYYGSVSYHVINTRH